MTQTRIMLLNALCLAMVNVAARAEDADFNTNVKPFLRTYCADCHGSADPEGDISLATLQGAMQEGEAKTWEKVYEQLTLSQMPPEDENQPSSAERTRVIQWIEAELARAGIKVESKLTRPGFGNYIKHELLFGDNKVGPSFSPPRLWRIRPAVYAAKLDRITRKEYAKPFTLKSGGHGFRDYANLYVLGGPDLNQLMSNAKAAAAQLSAIVEDGGQVKRGNRTPEQIFRLIDPQNDNPTDEQCIQAVDWLYHQVLLRDPTEEERQRRIATLREQIEANGRLLGVRNLISAVLLSPEALYRSERGAGDPDEHGRVMLAPRELAYAIAYALTDAPPDDELLKAADDGALATRDEVQEHVDRILIDPKINKPRILGFFREYFEYGGAEDVFKDAELFRSHAAVVLVRDTDHLVMHLYEQDKDVLRELLTTQKSFVQYDIDGKGQPKKGSQGRSGDGRCHLSYNLPLDWKWIPKQPITLPGKLRAGILTQPSWLVAKSGNFDNHAIRRGLWIRTKMLGGTIPDLPITVDAQLPNDDTLTLREKMQVTREQYCWKCHSKMNPLGLAFEQYDHFGRWRTKELGKPVDSSGWIDRSGESSLDSKVPDPIELVHKLADSQRVRQVFVRHAFRYWMGRNETLDDAATLRRADKAYVESGGSMKTMIVSLLTSDSFLFRKHEQRKLPTKG